MQYRWLVTKLSTVLTIKLIDFLQCQTAALDELFGNPEDCFTRYQSAQILLHSLAQKCTHPNDKMLLSKCELKCTGIKNKNFVNNLNSYSNR